MTQQSGYIFNKIGVIMKAKDVFLEELGSEGEEMLILLRETTELANYYRRLLERYELDTLTGLPGNNKFRDFLEETEKRDINVGILFFDVNGLKFYNDTMGHKAGDILLQKAAESIQLACVKNSRAFRIGGDEFVVIITDCVESEIDSFVSRWQNSLVEVNSREDDIVCSAAVGTAYGTGSYKIGDILKKADANMYINKRKMKSEEKSKWKSTK